MLRSPESLVASVHQDIRVSFMVLQADGTWHITQPSSFLNCCHMFRNVFMYVENFGGLTFIKYGVVPHVRVHNAYKSFRGWDEDRINRLARARLHATAEAEHQCR